MEKEVILQIQMRKDGEDTIFDFDNITKTEDGSEMASTFIKIIADGINMSNVNYAKMETDEGEVILK